MRGEVLCIVMRARCIRVTDSSQDLQLETLPSELMLCYLCKSYDGVGSFGQDVLLNWIFIMLARFVCFRSMRSSQYPIALVE